MSFGAAERTPGAVRDLAGPAIDAPPSRRAQLVLGLVVALAILAAAWVVVGRTGGASLGQGGVNQRLLPKVGQVAPDFETQDLAGNPVRLSDFRGRPVWLMFWGSWCPPCRAEFPDVQRAYEQLRPVGLELLGVSLNELPEQAALYAFQNGATFTVLSDPDFADTGAAYPIYTYPTHIFIDADGVVRSIALTEMNVEQAVGRGRALLEPDRAD